MITREIDYALRAVLYLTKQDDASEIVVTSKLAEEMDIPYRFLRKIISRLNKAGIVKSHRGKCGGVSLIRPSSEISLANVIDAIDSSAFKVNLCTDAGDCSRHALCCCLNTEMREIQRMLDEKLDAVRFSSLKDKPDAVDTQLLSTGEDKQD